MKLFNGQQKAIDEILDIYYEGKEKVIDFKAPTGSGKTFIAASLISEIIKNKKPDEKVAFVIATLSSSELPKQFENKLNEYMTFLPSKYNVEHIESPSNSSNEIKDYEPNIQLSENKVFIFGKSSFGKRRLLTEMGAFDIFVDQAKNEGYKLIYIRDEAHIGANVKTNKDENSLGNNEYEQTIYNAAHFIIRMTATPKPNFKQVVIKPEDLLDNEKSLLKNNDKYNIGIKNTGKHEIDDYDLLELALTQFKKIKNEYNDAQDGVNPAALIQVSSLSKDLPSDKLDEEIDKYINIIEKMGLSWMIYFGDRKETNLTGEHSLQNVSKHDSPIDVIIFKVGPATGWDIPRAAMLIQLRRVFSDSLNIQTLGRIKRNPVPGLFIKEYANKYYVYSNYQEPSRDLYMYQLKEKYQSINIPIIQAKKCDEIEFKSLSKLNDALNNFLSNNRDKIFANIGLEFGSKPERIAFKKRRYIDSDSKQAQYKIERIVNNALELHIELRKEIQEYSEQWSLMKHTILKHFNESKDFFKTITKSQYLFILWTKYLDELLKIFDENYVNIIEYDYVIKSNSKLKNNYMIWGNKQDKGNSNNNLIDFEDVEENYAYINTDNTQTFKQALDSNPETIFMGKIIRYIKQNNNFEMWTKNPSLGNGVFLEYKNSKGSISKTFIDFIFKTKNDWIYIEVKGHKDYDEDKTKKILEAFEEYKQKLPEAKNIHFAVVKVNTDRDDLVNFGAMNFITYGIEFGGRLAKEMSVEDFFEYILIN